MPNLAEGDEKMVEPPRTRRLTEGGAPADPAFDTCVRGLGAWEWNLEHREVWWSHELRMIYGIPEGEKPELTLEAFSRSIHPEDRARVMADGDRAGRRSRLSRSASRRGGCGGGIWRREVPRG